MGRHPFCPNHKHLSDTGQGGPHDKHTHRTQPPRRDPRRRLGTGYPEIYDSGPCAGKLAHFGDAEIARMITYVGPATAATRLPGAGVRAPRRRPVSEPGRGRSRDRRWRPAGLRSGQRAALDGVTGAYFCNPIAPGLLEATALFARCSSTPPAMRTTSLDRRTARPHAHAHHAPAAHVLRRVARRTGRPTAPAASRLPMGAGAARPHRRRGSGLRHRRPAGESGTARPQDLSSGRARRDEQDDIAEAIGRTLGCEYPDELYASEIADLVTQFLGCRVDRHSQQLQRVAAFPYRLCSRDAEHAKGLPQHRLWTSG